MSEGGLYAWKTQRIDQHRGPPASYAQIHKPLPNPPKNMHWVVDDDTKEWSLEPVPQTEIATVVAEIVSDNHHHHPSKKNDDDEGGEGGPPLFKEHHVISSDTFAGICIRYKLTPTELRQANCFSGSNLTLAPNPLRIPMKDEIVQAVRVFPSPQSTNDNMIRRVLKAYPTMAQSEAKCYLELNGWNVQEALKNALEDGFDDIAVGTTH